MPETNQSFSSSPAIKRTSSNYAPWSSETLTSQEKKRYKNALKEIYETVKMRTQTFETDTDVSEEFTQSDTDQQSAPTVSSSPKPETVTQRSQLGLARKMRKKRFNDVDLQEIYQELRVISQKLKRETGELQAWEEDLREREMLLRDVENIADTQEELVNENIEKELERRCTVLDEEYQHNLNELQNALLEKTKEANRLRDSFNTIRSTHEDLRKQFLDVQDQNKLLESRTLSLQQRLSNLLRKNEYQVKQREESKLVKFDDNLPLNIKHSNEDSMKHSVQSKQPNVSGILDVLASLLIWVSDAQLDYTATEPDAEKEQSSKNHEGQASSSKEHVHGRCVKILPPLADLLSYLPAVNPNVMNPLLKFIYSVILYMDHTAQSTQKPVLTSTLRRIGEELYKPEIFKQPELSSFGNKKEKYRASIYLRSLNMDERMLSTLIILKTISRADYLSHTFDVLKKDLREEQGKRLFILHNGVHVIIPFMKPRHKSILEYAVDVLLQMSMESGVVSEFLKRCSTGDFFNACVNLLQTKGMELKILEKFSIILQRLSKIRNNRRYFEAFQLVPAIQELLRQHDSDNAFLSLNLRSVLVNLNIAKNM